MERLKSAVEAGTNEVYLGLKGFGARRFAINFDIEEMVEAIKFCHSRGVKMLLTLNTLMKVKEMEALSYNLSRLYESGLDAVIVQDLGVFRYIKENFPKWTVHGSTQMTVSNHFEANYLQSLGFERVVLSRELSFEEIKKIRENTTIELEVFVSGSLCISYSGNCYISGFIGGRSGNRGMCAYSCRRMYRDNEDREGYLLSPNDQFMEKNEIEKLASIGVDAIKIEGRMKSPNYVYETVSYYRGILEEKIRKSNTYKIFNRGYSKGYFYGQDGKELMNYKYSSNFGYSIGEFRGKRVRLTDNIMLGDGITFLDEEFRVLQGEYLNVIDVDRKRLKKAKIGDVILLKKAPKGSKYLFKTFDKEINDSIERDLKSDTRKVSIKGEIAVKVGEKLSLKFYDNFGNSYEKEGAILESANKNPSTAEVISKKVSELGNTTLYLSELNVDTDEKAFLSMKELKNLKREVAEGFLEALLNSYRRENKSSKTFDIPLKKEKPKVKFTAKVKTKEQAKACKEMGIEKVYYDQADTMREENLEKCDLNSKLAGNLYQLLENKNEKVTTDWNFNVVNELSILEYSKINKCDTIYLSPEIDSSQLEELSRVDVKTGMVIYGYLKGMYIENLPYNKNYSEIRNEAGDLFKIKKNKLGNSELYWNEPMNLIPKLDEIEKFNFNELRLDFVFESPEEVRNIIASLQTRDGKYVPYNYERGIF